MANQGREQQRDHLNKQSPIFGLDEGSKNVLSCFSGQVTNSYCPAFCAPWTSHHVLVCSKPWQRSHPGSCLWGQLHWGEDDCVFCVCVCLQARREWAWKELLQWTGEFLLLAKSLDSSPKLVTTSPSTGLLSLPCWYLAPAFFHQLLRSSSWFWQRRGNPGLGLGTLLSWKGSCSGVQGALDLSALLLLLHSLPQGSSAPTGMWAPPWVFKSISFCPGLVSAQLLSAAPGQGVQELLRGRIWGQWMSSGQSRLEVLLSPWRETGSEEMREPDWVLQTGGNNFQCLKCTWP